MGKLSSAARKGQLKQVGRLLKRGVPATSTDKNKVTPLHEAARKGRAKVVDLLLTNGAEIDARTRKKSTALHEAARKGHGGVVRMLLAEGADPLLKDRSGKSPLKLAKRGKHKAIVRLMEKRLKERKAKSSQSSKKTVHKSHNKRRRYAIEAPMIELPGAEEVEAMTQNMGEHVQSMEVSMNDGLDADMAIALDKALAGLE
ncbi:MAG: ankyrin repeat domain-containing protein [Magnetococcales bacterium]|nr:ankyrin repeat domain-containing protein [Magnetococcales bacterium]